MTSCQLIEIKQQAKLVGLTNVELHTFDNEVSYTSPNGVRHEHVSWPSFAHYIYTYMPNYINGKAK